MADLVRLIKQAAAEAVAAQKPADIRYGTVVCAEPLEILLEQRLTLGAEQLVLPQCMTDHEVEIEAELTSGAAGENAHSHTLPERMKVMVINSLKAGEHVLLLRVPGGQKYIVMGRVVR